MGGGPETDLGPDRLGIGRGPLKRHSKSRCSGNVSKQMDRAMGFRCRQIDATVAVIVAQGECSLFPIEPDATLVARQGAKGTVALTEHEEAASGVVS